MIQVVILAAGQGKRMQSHLPKVLHCIGGKPILEHVVLAAKKITPLKPVIVVGHQGDLVKHTLAAYEVDWVIQKEQKGTAHALMQALPYLKQDAGIIVLCGDVPLIQSKTLMRLIDITPSDEIGMLTAHMPDPYGYGRILRKENKVVKIVEEKDASKDERNIKEINPGIYFVPASFLQQNLSQIKNKNAQQEFYLTDLIGLAVSQNKTIHTEMPEDNNEILGVNNRIQLTTLERKYQIQQAHKLMEQGVTIMDPARLDIRGEVLAGKDVLIDVNVILEGRIVLGDGCCIGANSILKNTMIGAHTEIKPFSYLDGVEVGLDNVIGPFARLRPGTVLKAQVHIGNFVEVKNSTIDAATKINHLSYIGDSEVGQRVNIGAGTITCNYDGANKYRTIIGDNTHIGSDTQLVAPVTIGEGATIAAGSTVTKDVPANQLTLTHKLEQRILENWQRPVKNSD